MPFLREDFGLFFLLMFLFGFFFYLFYFMLLVIFTATEASDVYEKHILGLRHLFWEYLSS